MVSTKTKKSLPLVKLISVAELYKLPFTSNESPEFKAFNESLTGWAKRFHNKYLDAWYPSDWSDAQLEAELARNENYWSFECMSAFNKVNGLPKPTKEVYEKFKIAFETHPRSATVQG